jgi:hypothetical protein
MLAVGPLTTAVPTLVVPSKKLTDPPRLDGPTVAVRVTGVPWRTGLAGLVARVTPATVTDPRAAPEDTAVQVHFLVPKRNVSEPMATGTTVPGCPVTPVTVPERPVQVTVSSPPVTTGLVAGGRTLPPGVKLTCADVTVLFVFSPPAGSMCSVIFNVDAAVDPVEDVCGTLAVATTDAAMFRCVGGLPQVKAVPGAAVVTVNVAEF